MPLSQKQRLARHQGRFLQAVQWIQKSNGEITLTQIAKGLSLPLPTLTHSIDQLETHIGEKLVNRHSGRGGPPRLTSAGERLFHSLNHAANRGVETVTPEDSGGRAEESPRPTRVTINPTFLGFDSILRILSSHHAAIEVDSSASDEEAHRRVTKGAAQIAITWTKPSSFATKGRTRYEQVDVDIVLASGDDRLVETEDGEINESFVRSQKLLIAVGEDDLPTLADWPCERTLLHSPELALSLARARMGVAVVPAGDFSALNRLRKSGALTFSRPIGKCSAYLVSPATTSALTVTSQKILGELLTGLRELGSIESPYFSRLLRSIPMAPKRYTGRKYGYFGAIHLPGPGRDLSADQQSIDDQPAIEWYAETLDIFRNSSARYTGAVSLKMKIQNLNFGTEYRPPFRFESNGILGGSVLYFFNRQVSRGTEKLRFGSLFTLYHPLDDSTDETGPGVWLGNWMGIWRTGTRPHAYPSLMADRPLSEVEIQRFSAMIDLYALTEPTEFNSSVKELLRTPVARQRSRRSTGSTGRLSGR